MKILLDSHVVLALLRGDLDQRHLSLAQRLSEARTIQIVSAASLWEIAIKTRLGKLDLGMHLNEVVGVLAANGASILPVLDRHVLAEFHPQPNTRDPFDRLLLAQCHVEGGQLATWDRALVDHPLALRLSDGR